MFRRGEKHHVVVCETGRRSTETSGWRPESRRKLYQSYFPKICIPFQATSHDVGKTNVHSWEILTKNCTGVHLITVRKITALKKFPCCSSLSSTQELAMIWTFTRLPSMQTCYRLVPAALYKDPTHKETPPCSNKSG